MHTKEDGKIYRLQYASRTIYAAERKYSACQRELLAVIFALQKFRVYLISTEPFKLVKDGQALSYAFKKNDVLGRLVRWRDFLAEYNFEVDCRPGSSNGATDYLSRALPAESRLTSGSGKKELAATLNSAAAVPFS